MVKSILAILLILPVFSASSSALSVREFAEIQQQSVRQLQSLDMIKPEILNRMADVEVLPLKTFVKPAGATRWAAYADPINQRVYLNQASPNFGGDPQVFVLHELFSAAGVPDTDYQNSVVATLMAKNMDSHFMETSMHTRFSSQLQDLSVHPVDDSNSNLAESKYINWKNRFLLYSDGSWTIFGSGGDILSAMVKARLIQRLTTELKSAPANYKSRAAIEWIYGLKIERMNSSKKNLRATARFNHRTNTYDYLIVAPSTFSVEQIEKDLWYFLVHANRRKNPDKLYNLVIPHTRLQKITDHRNSRP